MARIKRVLDKPGGRVIGTVMSEPGRGWIATSIHLPSRNTALCVSEARARTWVLHEHDKHVLIPVAKLKAEVDRA